MQKNSYFKYYKEFKPPHLKTAADYSDILAAVFNHNVRNKKDKIAISLKRGILRIFSEYKSILNTIDLPGNSTRTKKTPMNAKWCSYHKTNKGNPSFVRNNLKKFKKMMINRNGYIDEEMLKKKRNILEKEANEAKITGYFVRDGGHDGKKQCSIYIEEIGNKQHIDDATSGSPSELTNFGLSKIDNQVLVPAVF